MNTPAMAPRRSLVACLYLYIGCTALRLLPQCSATTPTLWFVEAPPAAAGSNDLLDLVRQAMPSAVRTGSIDNIVAGASEGDAVLVLAHEYPWRHAAAPSTALLAAAKEKRLHLYLEYLQDLDSFNRSSQHRGASACLDAKPADQIVANTSTTVRTLCACEGPGAKPSTVQFTGKICNARARSLLWEGMENLTPCHDCATKTCAWSAAGQPTAWKQLYTGSCGVAPSMLPDLPTHLCGGLVPPTPPTPPAPPSTITQVSWKKRAVVMTEEATGLGLVRDTILLPQGAYTNGWCASGSEDEAEGEGCAAGSSLSAGCAEACNTSILSLAKVAGVYTAVYGVPESIQEPILFEHRLGDAGDGAPPALVATTKLSSMVSGRFGPVRAWHSLWVHLLTKLGVPASTAQRLPMWKEPVGPAYSAGASLPLDAVRTYIVIPF